MNHYNISIENAGKAIYQAYEKFNSVDSSGRVLRLKNFYYEYNGDPFYIIMGEFHFSRYVNNEWDEEIAKIKASGVNTIATYVFWNMHERNEGRFDFNGDLDLKKFITLCDKYGLFVVLRIGPFCHGEVRNGGIPDWLFGRPFDLRSNDKRYLAYVKRLYTRISQETEGLYFENGGPIIGVQLENEFMHCGAPWETGYKQVLNYVPNGRGSEEHMMALKKIALEAGIKPVFFACTGWGSPIPRGEMLPLYGGYAFTPWSPDPDFVQSPTEHFVFKDFHEDPDIPNACCEMGGGIQVTYYHRPEVPPQSVEAMTVVRIAGGTNLLGYYMFHGGSNPELENIFYNEFTIPKKSYDFQAPISEFGEIRESYKRLKYIFNFLKKFGSYLAPMNTILPEGSESIKSEDVDSLRWCIRARGQSGFVFLNNYQDHVETKDITDISLTLKLESEKIKLPFKGTLTLKSGECAILPFNLNMNGAILKSSTAQLVSRLEVDGKTVYFFFEREGMKAEYCFSGSTIKTLYENSITVGEDVIIYPLSGADKSPVEIQTEQGKIAIVTLTYEEAMNFWVCNFGGKERAILTCAEIIGCGDNLKLRSAGNPNIEFKVFPPLDWNNEYETGTFGIFKEYLIAVNEKQPSFSINHVDDARVELCFEKNIFQELDDIYLTIDYIGDIGNAFSNGNLISDDFCYGKPWKIGLKRFEQSILEHGMYIYVFPAKKGQQVFKEVALAFRKEFIGQEIAKINNVILTPVYSVNIKSDMHTPLDER